MGDIKEVVASLELLFDRLNGRYFESELSRPVITVSPDHSGKAYGWCTTWKAWQDGRTDGYYEINVCAEYLNRTIEAIAETMLHEMVHLYNILHGVKDCSRAGTYHNIAFRDAALSHGLDCRKDAKYGWTVTELTQDAASFIRSICGLDFSLCRVSPSKGGKKKSSTRKYVCPVCGTIIRATKEVSVICASCSEEEEEAVYFELEEDIES